MKLELSCPSKTFLLGEYLVLEGGPALLMNTAPRFKLQVNTRGEGSVGGFHPDSPAGQWVRQNKLAFKNVDVDFIDPHEGRGGFGASSAQYLLTNILTQVLKNPASKEDFNIEQIWRAYRLLETVSAEGLRPSGADIVSQYVGGLCEMQTEPFQISRLRWPFEDYDVVLIPTGVKVATHEHLRGLKHVNTEELEWIYVRGIEAMKVKEAAAFFESVNDYYAELLEQGLVAEHTQVLAATLLSKPFVHAVKGCGAMGSDILAVFVAKESRKYLDKTLKEMNLLGIGDLATMSTGFEMQILPEADEEVSI